MWIGDDTDELVNEVIGLGLEDDEDESATLKKLAQWFTKLGDRVRAEDDQGVVKSAEARQLFEEKLLRLQSDIRWVAELRSAPLNWLPMLELKGTPGGTLRLIAGTVEALNYLSRRAELGECDRDALCD